MRDFYDDSRFQAPQYGIDTRHEVVSHQSGYNDFWKALADRVWRHPRLGATIVLGIIVGLISIKS